MLSLSLSALLKPRSATVPPSSPSLPARAQAPHAESFGSSDAWSDLSQRPCPSPSPNPQGQRADSIAQQATRLGQDLCAALPMTETFARQAVAQATLQCLAAGLPASATAALAKVTLDAAAAVSGPAGSEQSAQTALQRCLLDRGLEEIRQQGQLSKANQGVAGFVNGAVQSCSPSDPGAVQMERNLLDRIVRTES